MPYADITTARPASNEALLLSLGDTASAMLEGTEQPLLAKAPARPYKHSWTPTTLRCLL